MDIDLIQIGLQAANYTEVIESLGRDMLKKNYVRDSYVQAVLDREANLPTGLDLNNFGVAIPHTDSNHVNSPAIAVAILEKPVNFHCMVDPSKEISVRLVFLLAIKNPAEQVSLLQSLMSVFQNIDLLKTIQSAKTKEEVAGILNEIIH